MPCELWQRGSGESGSGPLNYDRLAVTNWNPSQPIPPVTLVGYLGNNGYGPYYRYQSTVNPGLFTGGWYSPPELYLKGCGPAGPYDCINGGCLPKTTYNTPGVFASLAACQSGCAKNSNCKGECVSADELAALQQAAANLKARYCK
jgi:hypothetical protein